MLSVFIAIGILILPACIAEIFVFALIIKEYIKDYKSERNKIMVIKLKEGMDPILIKELIESFEHKVSHGD